MKILELSKTLILGLFPLLISACNPNSIDKIRIQSTVVGVAKSTPSITKLGEELTFTIEGNITSSSVISVNGEEYYPIIHYLIDGKDVVTSAEKTMPFKASYVVTDLSIGEHVLSVEITGSHKIDTYINSVGSSILTIE